MINFNLHINLSSPKVFDRWKLIGMRSGGLPFPGKNWEICLYKSSDIINLGANCRTEVDHSGFLLSCGLLGHRIELELYDNRHYVGDKDIYIIPVLSEERPPSDEEMEPKLRYCWWWNSHEYSWEYADCRHCDLSIYTHFLHWQAIPHPTYMK